MHHVISLATTLTSLPVRFALKIFADFKVIGIENLHGIDRSKGVIFASNHNSQSDTLMIPCALPLSAALLPVYFVSRPQKDYSNHKIGKYFYGTSLFTLLGGIPAVKGFKDYRKTLARHLAVLTEGKTVAIYPEGRVVSGYEMGKAHGGLGYLATASDAVIVPIAIRGNENMTMKSFFSFKNKLSIEFGTPIPSTDFILVEDEEENVENYKKVAQYVLNVVYLMLEADKEQVSTTK